MEPLRSARLELETVRESHAGEVWPQLDDDRMWTYFPELRPATIEALRELYAKWERGSGDPSTVWLNWHCREREHGEVVGAMQATIFAEMRIAYVAWAVYPAHQRKGYAAEAVRAVINHVRDRYRIRRFLAEMNVENEPSYRLAQSLGFEYLKTRGSDYVYELRHALTEATR
jgi:RimJ/RimL family protein N-acetyltransferase